MPSAQLSGSFSLHRRMRLFTFEIFLLYFLYSIILVPIHSYVSSDIAFAGTMVLELVEWLYQIVELLALCFAFATLINTRFCFGYGAGMRILGIYAAAALFRYLSVFFISWRINGLDVDDIALELIFLAVYILLDVTQALVAFVTAHLFSLRYERVFFVRARALAAKGQTMEDKRDAVVPYKELCSMRNPLQGASVTCGVIILVARVVGRVIYDISYGAPADFADVLWMIFYYIGDIAISVLCGALIMLLIRRMDCKTEVERKRSK